MLVGRVAFLNLTELGADARPALATCGATSAKFGAMPGGGTISSQERLGSSTAYALLRSTPSGSSGRHWWWDVPEQAVLPIRSRVEHGALPASSRGRALSLVRPVLNLIRPDSGRARPTQVAFSNNMGWGGVHQNWAESDQTWLGLI